MLALRPGMTFALLLAVAGIYAAAGNAKPFESSAAWWLWFLTLANLAVVALMAALGRRERLRLRDMSFANRSTWKKDLPWVLLAFIVIPIVAQPPGMALANLFWGGSSVPNNMLFRPLPLAAIWPLFVLMPLTHAFGELPLYWGYAAPRLRAAGMNRWLAILVVSAVLSIQHLAFSFQPDWRYCVWLAVKFFPFALWTGFVTDRRPTALPYLMAGHAALDAALPYLVLIVSRGGTL